MSIRTVFSSAAVVLVVLLAMVSLRKRVDIPPHLLRHPATFVPSLLDEDTGRELDVLLREMKDYPNNLQDTKFYKTLHEHTGEATPLVNDACEHPFMAPNRNRTACVMPGRVDVGRHYAMFGGVIGLKNGYNTLISRVQSFGRYMFDLSKYPVAESLFASDKFIQAAKDVCPEGKQFLDPFQFNFIIQVPGQTVALHLDAPVMWGATRFQFPQWLLVSMVFSNLFQERFVNQVQVVAYVHKWNDTKDERSGKFVYWNKDDLTHQTVSPLPLAGSAVDGSKTVHAATTYFPDVSPPYIDRSKDNVLSYLGEDKWHLTSNGEVIQKYDDDDLRKTVVYRARCFKDEEEMERFKNQKEEDNMKLEDILETFRKDLVARGKLSEGEVISPIDFNILILNTYIKYPLPVNALIPYNYCMLPRLYPWTETLLSPFC
eukprot:TRINITY_DN6190_c0_g1_i1.p1 TRINITY_DN6190_c0_g1~~TRINITY_DN6190_c0_g1_i1.p1  ORF type:complete len:430 (-),score=101.56 TRINITY_DN6190_c0_g1_i1:45-1334(-)